MRRRNFLAAAGASVLGLFTAAPSLGSLIPSFLRPMPAKLCVWTGAVSEDVTDPRNWRRGKLPFDGCDLTVTGGRTLLITEPLNIGTLTVMEKASVGFQLPAGPSTCMVIGDLLIDHESQA